MIVTDTAVTTPAILLRLYSFQSVRMGGKVGGRVSRDLQVGTGAEGCDGGFG